jgi:DNA (cytosine-5)-methyltransferase 1
MTPSRPTAIDLFSGAGGLSLGFEQAGFDVLAAVEYDPIHAATHAFNFPATKVLCADASLVSSEELLDAAAEGWRLHDRDGRWSRRLDVLIGGPPCQGFSNGGKRETNDERNRLVFAFARLVGELKPRYFVLENVQGLASFLADEHGNKLLDRLVDELRRHNYTIARPEILNACAYGVPQDRRRLFLVGTRSGDTRPDYPAATTRGRPRRPRAPIPTGANNDVGQLCPSIAEAIHDLPEADDFAGLIDSDEIALAPAVTTTIDKSSSRYAAVLRGLEVDPSDYSYKRKWDRGLLTSSCRTTHTPEVRERFAATQQGSTEAVSRFVRLHPDGVAPTLRAGTHYERGSFNAPRPIHPSKQRVITVREAARLHSFPDWFRLHWTKWHGFRQVGNSVAPLVGRAVGETIRTALGVTPVRPTKTLELGERELLYLENTAAARRLGANHDRMPRNSQRRRQLPVEDDEIRTPDVRAAA